MEKIASFTVDHTNLEPGLYISRVDGDITTYDLRFKAPNKDELLENAAIHTIEHLAATYLRNTKYMDKIIYFGPMGCRTGFYFLLRDGNYGNHCNDYIKSLLIDTFAFIKDYEGEIPGVSAKECGNYKEHDLIKAKSEAKEYHAVLKNINSLEY